MDFGTVVVNVLLALSPVTLAGLTWLSLKLAEFIRAKVDHTYLQGVLLRLNDSVLIAVKDVEQRLVEEARDATQDRKLTPQEARRFKEVAMGQLRSYLGPKGLQELSRILGLSSAGVNSVLDAKIEAAVLDLKRQGVPLVGEFSAIAA